MCGVTGRETTHGSSKRDEDDVVPEEVRCTRLPTHLRLYPAIALLLRVPCPKILNPIMADSHFGRAGKRNTPIYKLFFV